MPNVRKCEAALTDVFHPRKLSLEGRTDGVWAWAGEDGDEIEIAAVPLSADVCDVIVFYVLSWRKNVSRFQVILDQMGGLCQQILLDGLRHGRFRTLDRTQFPDFSQF